MCDLPPRCSLTRCLCAVQSRSPFTPPPRSPLLSAAMVRRPCNASECVSHREESRRRRATHIHRLLLCAAAVLSLASCCHPKGCDRMVVGRTNCDASRCDLVRWRGVRLALVAAAVHPPHSLWTGRRTMRRETRKCWRSSSDPERSDAPHDMHSTTRRNAAHWRNQAALCRAAPVISHACPAPLMVAVALQTKLRFQALPDRASVTCEYSTAPFSFSERKQVAKTDRSEPTHRETRRSAARLHACVGRRA